MPQSNVPNLHGKTVLVTGASRGIGAAIARACATGGANVLVHYSGNKAKAELVAAELGAKCSGILQADFALPDAAARLWQDAVARGGHVDGVVNNAGVFAEAPFDLDDTTWLARWNETMQINLTSTALLTKHAVAHFRQHGGGTILNIASRAGHRGDDVEFAAYAASKGGMLALTKTLARGLGKDNIKAYAIAPGWVDTDMAQGSATAKQQAKTDIPLGRMAEDKELGALAAFLLSDECPSATGATFDVNGASYVR